MHSNGEAAGAPLRVAGNSAAAYYPGNRYVNVVGDDLSDKPGHGAIFDLASKPRAREVYRRQIVPLGRPLR